MTESNPALESEEAKPFFTLKDHFLGDNIGGASIKILLGVAIIAASYMAIGYLRYDIGIIDMFTKPT